MSILKKILNPQIIPFIYIFVGAIVIPVTKSTKLFPFDSWEMYSDFRPEREIFSMYLEKDQQRCLLQFCPVISQSVPRGRAFIWSQRMGRALVDGDLANRKKYENLIFNAVPKSLGRLYLYSSKIDFRKFGIDIDQRDETFLMEVKLD